MLDDLASCCHKQHRQCCQSSLPQAYHETNILRALLHNSWAHSFELLPFCFLLLLLHTLLILALGLLKTFQVWQVGRNPSFCSETYQNDSTPFRKYKNTTLLYIVIHCSSPIKEYWSWPCIRSFHKKNGASGSFSASSASVGVKTCWMSVRKPHDAMLDVADLHLALSMGVGKKVFKIGWD